MSTNTTQHVAMKGAYDILRTYYDGLVSVPLDDDWAAQEVDINDRVVSKLRNVGAAHVVERGDARRRYRLHPAFARRLDAFEPRSAQLPYGHHGYHNIVGGDGFLCKFDGCSERFSRATIEGVLDGA